MTIKKSLGLLSICLVTACAPHKQAGEMPVTTTEKAPQNKVMPVEKRKAQTATVSSWEINGALAAKNKAKGWSATLNWVQNGASSSQIRLMGPLGSGTVIISKHGSTVSIQDGAKKSSSTNADTLFQQQTGIRLPVNNLYYWVRGLPAPGTAQSEVRDDYNHLIKLKQSGYLIDFTKYSSVNGIDLPSMIRLEGNGMMIKVIIKSWRVNA